MRHVKDNNTPKHALFEALVMLAVLCSVGYGVFWVATAEANTGYDARYSVQE
jgi:hypothetical protein